MGSDVGWPLDYSERHGDPKIAEHFKFQSQLTERVPGWRRGEA
jgi:hypothetical protein